MSSATAADADLLAPAAELSVREFARTARGSHRGTLDLAHYAASPLDGRTLDLVDYLARLERGAMRYLRAVLVTPTHKDARVTAFLVTWAYEKYWIADALEQIVLAHGRRLSVDAPDVPRVVRLARAFGERVEPIRGAIVANVIGEDVVAVHTATGAVDDWILGAAYGRLAEQTTDDELRRTLRELHDVKTRHEAFFSAQARDRLARSPRAVSLARRRLCRTTWPLGADGAPATLAARLFTQVLRRSDVEAVDRRIATLLGADAHPVHAVHAVHPVHEAAVRAVRAARREGARA